MKKLIFILGFFSLLSVASAQNRFGSTDGVAAMDQFGGQTFIQFDENPTKYFWAVNLSGLLPAQKSTFEELVFHNEYLIAVSVPDERKVWYLASYKKYEKTLINDELNKILNKAINNTQTQPAKYQ